LQMLICRLDGLPLKPAIPLALRSGRHD